jgi:two-component system chemotaxis response regulator CheB
VVVVGGSAGSLEPLRELATALPADLPGPVLVTIHVGEGVRTELPSILARAGALPAAHAIAGERLRPGRIYVAPPGSHLVLPGGVAELSTGPRVNYSRPAADVMFASAARWFGARVVAVVLSGLMDDGARGAALVARAGGVVMVQEPGEAEHSSMPLSALGAASEAIAAPARKLGEMVGGILGEPRTMARPCPGPPSRAPDPADSPEAQLWRAVAALERTAVLARLLAGYADAGEGDADRHSRTVDRVTRLAKSLRAQMRQTPER